MKLFDLIIGQGVAYLFWMDFGVVQDFIAGNFISIDCFEFVGTKGQSLRHPISNSAEIRLVQ